MAKVLNPRSLPMHVSLHCGHVGWWFITGNKTHRQIILWQEAGESSVCGGRAGVRSTFLATINERSHAKFTLSLLLGPSIRQAQVSLACSLTTWALKLSEATVTRAPGRCFDIMAGQVCNMICDVSAHFHLYDTKFLFEKRAFVSLRQILLLNHKLHRAVVLKSALAAWNVKIMLKIIKFNSYSIFHFS